MSKTNTTRNQGINYGLMIGAVLVAIDIVAFVTATYGETYYSYLGWGLVAGMMVYASSKLRESLGGFMTLGQGFRINLTLAVVGYTLQSIVRNVYMSVVDPNAKAEFLERTRVELLSNPEMPEEAVEMALQYTEKMMAPAIAIPLSIIFAAFFGAILGVIIAAIMKKDPPAGHSPS